MNQELKDAIIAYIQANTNEFQLNNATTGHFKQYIYTHEGNYAIGGEEVAQFINEFIKLYVL